MQSKKPENWENRIFPFTDGTLKDRKFPAKSFDVVTAYNVLLYMENQEEVLEQIYEVLKPGGLFISATDCLAEVCQKKP